MLFITSNHLYIVLIKRYYHLGLRIIVVQYDKGKKKAKLGLLNIIRYLRKQFVKMNAIPSDLKKFIQSAENKKTQAKPERPVYYFAKEAFSGATVYFGEK